jgi:tRNA 2-thiouridine synthesizing protein D
MNYCLHLTSAPYSQQSATSALLFAEKVLARGHSISRIFFSGEGVLNGNALSTPPQDESNISQAWSELAKTHQIELILCVASALKHGVINEQEAKRYQKNSHNLQHGFEISGLGQLVEACLVNDRVVTF